MKRTFARYLLLLLLVGGLASIASARDEWTQVRSKNFLLIGNASEKDIRNVADRLERFRSALSRLFDNADLTSPVGTNVVVFRDEKSYMPYKPLRRDGKVDASVEGYFQSGSDVNYITVTIGHGDETAYRTIFHEYVHFVVGTLYPKTEVPVWFNEGLAEYYSTFVAKNDRTAEVGAPIKDHVNLLGQFPPLPLDTLFPLRGSDVNNSSAFSRLLFYAESWAFVHYLIESGRTAQLEDFVKQVLSSKPMDEAFKGAFHEDFRSMEKGFYSYIGRKAYATTQIDLGDAAKTNGDVQISRLSSASTDAYLGDLLFHLDRPAEAERPLMSALAADPQLEIANADLGMIRFQQQKFTEARKYLEIAIKGDKKSAPILYRYAYVLSRDGVDPNDNAKEYDPATLKKMRDALHRAITVGPSLTGSYDLLALIDLTQDEDLDEAATAMQAALHYEPGRIDFALRLADVYVRQKKFDLAREIAERVSRYAPPDLKRRATAILTYIHDVTEENKKREPGDPAPLGPKTDPPMTRAEVDDANTMSTLRSMNADLRVPEPGEKRVLGKISRIACASGEVVFAIRAADRDLSLTSKDFESLILRGVDQDIAGTKIGCDAELSTRTAVVTYKDPRELIAVEFVPANFRLLAPGEMAQPRARLVREDQVDGEGYSLKDRSASGPAKRENVSRDAILTSLGTLADGEMRAIGYLQAIECADGLNLLLRTSGGTLRLRNASSETLHIPSLVDDIPAIDIGCSSRPFQHSLVVTYQPSKDGHVATLSRVAIVPLDFTLD